MAFSARGRVGQLRKGYQVAARLGAWTWDGGGRVQAAADEVSDYWLAEAGQLELRLDFGRRLLVWKDVQLAERDGGQLVIAVTGQPELRAG